MLMYIFKLIVFFVGLFNMIIGAGVNPVRLTRKPSKTKAKLRVSLKTKWKSKLSMRALHLIPQMISWRHLECRRSNLKTPQHPPNIPILFLKRDGIRCHPPTQAKYHMHILYFWSQFNSNHYKPCIFLFSFLLVLHSIFTSFFFFLLIVHNANGEVIAALSEKIPYPVLVDLVEVLAARRAVRFIVELGISQSVFEGDSEVVYKALKSVNVGHSSMG